MAIKENTTKKDLLKELRDAKKELCDFRLKVNKIVKPHQKDLLKKKVASLCFRLNDLQNNSKK